MRILHLSDLHLTDKDFPSLEAAFGGVLSHLGNRKLDFIVVSGDLSQEADPDEYGRLLAFSEGTLLPLLNKRERPRVIFVPGNHDVAWGAEIWEEKSIGQIAKDLDAKSFQQLLVRRRDPEHRVDVDGNGHLRFYKRRKNYLERFGPVEKFFTNFYGDTMKAPHRMMALTTSDGDAWSAHVFPEEDLAFAGFNSCCDNDRYWTGAKVHSDAIARAGAYLQQLAKRPSTAIAVWHHGLVSDDQRADYLMPKHIGRIYEAGFTYGMHGHTHRDGVENTQGILNGRHFTIVATGSLGAGSKERPGAVGNQFSIVDLLSRSVRVRTFERQGQGNTYSERHRRLSLAHGGPPKDIPYVASHTRECIFDDRGIATVGIDLKDVEVRDPLVLAVVSLPYCEVAADSHAETDLGRKLVREELLSGGARIFRVEAGSGDAFRWLKWKYKVSNTLALDQDELLLLPDQVHHYPNAMRGAQVRPHTCRFLTENMTLKLTFPAGKRGMNPEPFVERNVSDPLFGQERWERVGEIEGSLRVVATGDTLTLNIPAPVPGYRYGIMHTPIAGAGTLDKGGLRWATLLLNRCRNGQIAADQESTDKHLTNALAEALSQTLGSLRGMNWFGMLLEESSRHLVTAFGNFRASRFAVGDGVVGHAVRIRNVAAFSKKHVNEHVLYKRIPPGSAPAHSWIVSVPLLLGPELPTPVGAISIWSQHGDVQAAGTLKIESMIDELMATGNSPLANELLVRLNLFFWTTCKTLDPDSFEGLHVGWEE